MAELQVYQYVLIGLVFVWSGFVRSGLGFGGAVMSLPFLLLIDNRPLVYLPIIAVHLLFFSSITVWQNHLKHREEKFRQTMLMDEAQKSEAGAIDSSATQPLTAQPNAMQPNATQEGTIDWAYLKKSMKVMIIPKLIGVAGLLTIPASVITGIIFFIVSVYSVSYILNKPFKSTNPWLDKIFLVLGAYISGTSLIGAPLIISVFATHVAKHQLRDTLFVLWFILVVIKMIAFIIAGVDLQLAQHLWLLPCATIGHLIGLRFHQKIVDGDPKIFYRVLGVSLLCVSLMGVVSLFVG
jgi:uncharacterized membrane protein YfcA